MVSLKIIIIVFMITKILSLKKTADGIIDDSVNL